MLSSLQLRLLLHATQLILLCSASLVSAYSSGAPHHRCSNLVPFHGSNPQTSKPPYKLEVNASRYSPGDRIKVTLRGINGAATFKGFALTAHRLTGDTEDLVGSFLEIPSNARGNYWYSANSREPNCVTHSSDEDTEDFSVIWNSPNKSVGDIAFSTPVVQSFSVFWANVTSAVVVANVPSDDTTFPVLNIGRSPSPIVGSCGTDFGCVRSPALCNLDNCEIYVKFVESEGKLKFELHATGNYISLGLSEDDKMQDDLTLTCTSTKEEYSMQIGYNPNYAYLNERHRWTPMVEKYIERLSGNRIRCEFGLPLSINITAFPNAELTSRQRPIVRSFDLRSPHYVFIAYGETHHGTNTVVKHVELPAISDAKVNLLGRGSYSAHRITPLRRAHGSVMLLAWQALLPLGANLAMFYRSLFSKSLGGVQLWFHLHRGLVLSAYGFTVIGLLLIFAQYGWSWQSSSVTTMTHGIMGLTLLCLASIQILMGVLRPDKDTPHRPLFNVAHRVVAYSAMTLADTTMITIGFLNSLPESYRISHLVVAFAWLAYNIVFRIVVGVQVNRWNSKSLLLGGEQGKQVEWEKMKHRKLHIAFVIYLCGLLVIFFAWFIALMLF